MQEVPGKTMDELVKRAKLGDREAFGLLYREYFTPLYRFIYFKVGNREEAEDLTQESFIKALNSLERLRGEGGFTPWIYAIARNTVIDFFRQKKTLSLDKLFEQGLELSDNLPGIEAGIIKEEETKIVFRVLGKMEEEVREILILKYVEGLSYRDISVIVEKSEEAARQTSSRGLKKLRERLEEEKSLWKKE